jgi:hypothetical protein
MVRTPCIGNYHGNILGVLRLRDTSASLMYRVAQDDNSWACAKRQRSRFLIVARGLPRNCSGADSSVLFPPQEAKSGLLGAPVARRSTPAIQNRDCRGPRSKTRAHLTDLRNDKPGRCCGQGDDYKIFLPKADIANSTARLAVRLCSSITGLTSTTSKLSIRPWSAMISMAKWASR